MFLSYNFIKCGMVALNFAFEDDANMFLEITAKVVKKRKKKHEGNFNKYF